MCVYYENETFFIWFCDMPCRCVTVCASSIIRYTRDCDLGALNAINISKYFNVVVVIFMKFAVFCRARAKET